MTRSEWFRATLSTHRAYSVLAIRRGGPLPSLAEAAAAAGIAPLDWLHDVVDTGVLATCGRYDAAIVVDQLECMAADQRRHLLARLRDVHAPRVAVCLIAEVAARWPANEWRSLGFLPGRALEDAGHCYATFEFDLASSTAERTWNSPEHWAHPGNFQRYRW